MTTWGLQTLRYVNGKIHSPGKGPHGRRRVVILIHGFNNDRAQARENYASLLKNLPARDVSIAADAWNFFWPSYVAHGRAVETAPFSEDGTEGRTLTTLASFRTQTAKAIHVGRALGEYCAGLEGTQVVFVAHSLGCRVVLEALKAWTDKRGGVLLPADAHVACLMAAAVAVHRLSKGSELEKPVASARSYVLHSRHDAVLQFAFRAGDTSLPHPFPEAVGRAGNPTAAWPRRRRTTFGHSEYWKSKSAGPAVLTAVNFETERELPSVSLDVDWVLPERDMPHWRWRH